MGVQFRCTNNGRYFITHAIRSKRRILDDNKLDSNAVDDNRIISNKNLNIGYSNNGISKNTSDKIKIRCRVLGFIAENKEIRNSQGIMVKHKTSFITLTLPSKQVHEDKEITKIVLGGFLDKCRKSGILKNYVWKAEKQKNGNIHYHILTDSYCNKTILYRFWLISVNRLGYLERYTDKFKEMDLQSYKKLKFNINKSDYKINKAYWKGNKNNWKLPPCYDSKIINNDNSIEKYLSKYMSKGIDGIELKVNGKQWGCSSNISDGVELFKNDTEFNNFGFNICKYVLNKVSYIGDFFEVILYDISKFFVWFPDVAINMISKLRVVIPPCTFYKIGTASLIF